MRRSAFNKALVIFMTFVLVFSSNSTLLTPILAYAVEETAAETSAQSETAAQVEVDASETEKSGDDAQDNPDAASNDSAAHTDGLADSDSQSDGSDSVDTDSAEAYETDKGSADKDETASDDEALVQENDSELQAVADELVTVSTETKRAYKDWVDNNDSTRPDVNDTTYMKLFFKKGDASSWTELTESNLSEVNLDTIPTISVSASGTNRYTFSAADLPTELKSGDTTIAVAWKIDEEASDEASTVTINSTKYARSISSDGVITNTKLMDFTVKVKNLTGMESDKYNQSGFKVWQLTGSDPTNADSWTLVQEIQQEDVGAYLTQSDGNIYNLTIPDLPKYNSDNTEITYSVTSTNSCPTTEEVSKDPAKYNYDWYAPTYENSESANHGTEVDRAYENGTIVLTRTSATVMKITKKWLDGDGSSRPAYDSSSKNYQFWLWRYIKKDSNNYKNAAQVLDGNGYPVGADLPNNGSNAFVDGEIIFSYKHEAGDTDDTQYLPKYDAEGYEYVYLAREDFVDSRYEQVFGTVNDGTIYDVDAAGEQKKRTDDEARSDSSDESIYNGGTITNRLKGTVTTEATKTWEAAAHQSYLKNYSIEMKLQSRRKGTTAWSDSGITKTIDGFSPTVVSQTVSETAEQYDAQGYELEYQWVEGSIKYTDASGAEQMATASADGKFTTSYNSTQTGDSSAVDKRYNNDWYESETTTDDDGNVTITNTLKGYEDYLLRKIWKNADGEIIDAPDGATITVRLYRDGSPYTVKQNDDIEAYTKDITLTASDVTTVNQKWDYYFKNLPKYDSEGREYTYSVVETSASDSAGTKYNNSYANSDTDTDVSERVTVVTNAPGIGGQRIRIEKKWLDDSDVANREQVNVKITYKAKSSADATNYEDKEGTVTLTAGNDWWTYYGFEGNDGKDSLVDLSTVSVSEVSLGAMSDSHVAHEVTTADNVSTVTTENFKYIVTNPGTTHTTIGDDQVYTIKNRRVGTVNIAVTKTWNDGSNEAQNRPDGATLTLTDDSSRTTISDATVKVTSSEGNGNQTYNIKSGTSESIDNGDGTTTVKVTAGSDSANSTQTVNTDDTSTYFFCNLPKYDMEGRIIRYNVTEKYANNKTTSEAGDYVVVAGGQTYANDELNGDSQTQVITNSRVATTAVNIYKTWKDAYQYAQGNRPDITLTLWQSKSTLNSDGSYAVTYEKYNGDGFKNYKWNPKDASSEKRAYELIAEFGSLPKYDSNGREIEYYFEESIPAGSVTNFDYNETEYKNADGDEATIDNGWVVKLDASGAALSPDSGEAAVHTLLKANGTFVNSISKSVTIQGIKYWQNIPSGFPAAQMPNITVDLYQKSGDPNNTESAKKVANTSSLTRTETNKWTFAIDKDSNGSALPKYDDEGHLYEYSIKENIDTSGISADNWKIVYNTSESGFSITNVYEATSETNSASLKITKGWDRQVSGSGSSVYPMVTFEIHQVYTYTDEEGQNQTVDTVCKTAKSGSDGSETKEVTVEGLPVVAPDGKTNYKYYVVEKDINGYTTSDYDTEGTSAKNAVVLAAGETKELAKSAANDFSNVYKAGMLTINGTKAWNDGSDAAGLRTQPTLTLKRHANAQSGANNAISEEVVSKEPTWAQNGDSWNFTYSDLDKWAPNGTAWIYTVEESIPDGYAATYSSTALSGDSSTSEVNLTITNKYTKSAEFDKDWQDANNVYGTRPNYLKLKLQVALVDSADAAIPTGDAGWKDVNESSDLGSPLSQYLCTTFSGNESNCEKYTSASDGWKCSVSNLPAMAKIDDKTYYLKYRIIEVLHDAKYALGNESNNNPSGDTELKDYKVTIHDTTENNNKFTATTTNELETTSLNITKAWDDSDNYFGLRPKSVNFTLWYKTSESDAWSEWAKHPSLTKSGASTGSWSLAFNGLPKSDVNGNNYIWGVTEKDVDSNYDSSNPTTVAADGVVNPVAEGGVLTNTLHTASFKLEKKGSDGTITEDLKGVTFDVYQGNKKIFTWATDASGSASVTGDAVAKNVVSVQDNAVTGLAQGTYTFKEVRSAAANPLYNQEMQFTLTVDAAGAITNVVKVANTPGEVALGDDFVTITATDELAKASFTINKVLEQDDGTTSALSGVTFQLYKYNAENQSYEKVDGATAITDASGKAVFADLLVGKYFVVETQVPDKVYYNYETGYFFEVTNTNGGMVVSDSTTKDVAYTAEVSGESKEVTLANGNLSISNNTATIINTTMNGKIKFKKLDGTDKTTALTDATFKLYHKGYGQTEFALYKDENGQEVVISDANEDGIYEKSGLEYGDYKLVEVTVPEGYTAHTTETIDGLNCVATFTIEESDSGKVKWLDDIYNERILGTLELTKKSDDGTLQGGVEFELQKQNGADWESASTYSTGADGVLKAENLEWGTYRIRETKPAAGYVSGDDASWSEFEIAATSTIVKLNLTNTMSDITIKKTDSDGTALDGAAFTLKNAAGEAVTSWTTDETGAKELKGLLNQGETYTLTETRRAGYYALDGDIEFAVGSDGKVTLSADANGAATVDEMGVVITVTNTLICRDFEFAKAKYINEACADKTLSGGIDPSADEALEGATFELSLISTADKNATFDTQTAVSDAQGKVSFTNLIEGTYKLEETAAPEGVQLFPVSTLELTSEGKFILSNENQTYEIDESGLKLVDEIDRADLSFTKVSDVDGTTPIAGATYQLYRMDAVSNSGLGLLDNLLSGNSEGTLVAEATSDDSGKVSYKGLLPEYTYRLHEKEAPAGSLRSAKDVVVYFEKDEATSAYKLVIDDDGESDVDGKAYYTAKLDENGNLVWYEPQTEYNFVKLTTEGEKLAGAKLQVEDASGAVIDSWTSTDEPYSIIGKLEVGKTYRLVETEAPEGYEVAVPVEFTVENENSKGIDEDSALPGRQHTVTIVMVDEETPEEPFLPNDDKTDKKPSTKKLPQTGDTSANPVLTAIIAAAGVALVVVGLVMGNRKK